MLDLKIYAKMKKKSKNAKKNAELFQTNLGENYLKHIFKKESQLLFKILFEKNCNFGKICKKRQEKNLKSGKRHIQKKGFLHS